MDPATLALIGSSLFGTLMPEKKKNLTPEEKALLSAQTRNTDQSTRSSETSRQGTEVDNALSRLKLSRKASQDNLFRALQAMAIKQLPWFAQQGFDFSNLNQPTPFVDPATYGLPPAKPTPEPDNWSRTPPIVAARS